MKSVRKLPTEVCTLLRSGVIIPSPSQAVAELVLNSIDAEASSVAVRVDLGLFKIQVIDNGHGISSSDLESIGNRSVTSKCYTLDEFYNNLMYHGYRGESLASLREMCGLLEIVTHARNGDKTYSKLFVHGKEEKVKISDLKRPANGTTVTITDFMFNMPVRRARMKEAVEIEAIRSCIEYIALAHPEISISVRNDSKGRIILEKHKSSDLLNAFEHLFGHNLARTLAPIDFATEKFKINGYISKEAYRHNDMQFIYVNRQPVMKTKLHKLVTVLLSKSSIIRTNGPWKSKPISKNVPVERWLSFPSLEKQKKFGVFVLNITCARKEYELYWDFKKPMIYFKDWEGILSCISNAVQKFLRLENLVEEDEGEDEQQCISKKEIEDKETSNYSTKKHPYHQETSHSTCALPPQVPSKHNQQIEYEVETWNIQGAVHGFRAKRPKEKTKFSISSEETVNQKQVSPIQDRGQILTSDSNKESELSELDSVPPVVKFVRKYEADAHHLKRMEKEEEKEGKKLKIAEKLERFKLSNKPKLNSIKKGKTCHKKKLTTKKSHDSKLTTKIEKGKDQIPLKLYARETEKEKKITTKNASEFLGRQFLTPASDKSTKMSVLSELDSVPPIVKFVRKYEAAEPLQITKGAYRLKRLEEEEKKLKLAEKLEKFKLPCRPKLNSVESDKKVHERKLTSKKFDEYRHQIVRNDHVPVKMYTRDIEGENTIFVKKANELEILNSNDSSSQDDFFHWDSESHNKIHYMNLPQNKTNDFLDSKNSSNAGMRSSLSYDFGKQNIKLQSEVSSNSSELVIFPNNSHQFESLIHKGNTKNVSPCALSLLDETNMKSFENFHESPEKVFDFRKRPSYSRKSSRNILYNNSKTSVFMYGHWRSDSFGTRKHNENDPASFINLNPSKNFKISEMMTMSIPTPQSKNIPTATVSSSQLTDISDCSTKVIEKGPLELPDKPNTYFCPPEFSSLFQDAINNHSKNKINDQQNNIRELFVCNSDAHTCELNSTENMLPLNLDSVKGKKPVECSFGSSPLHKNISEFHSFFSPENKINNTLFVDENEKILNAFKKSLPNDATSLKSPEKVMNFKNVFETFENNDLPENIAECRSPYFNCKKKFIPFERKLNSSNFKLRNFINGSENVEKSCNKTDFEQSDKGKDNVGLLSIFDEPEDNQRELFQGIFDDKNKNVMKEIVVQSSFNVPFSDHGYVKKGFDILDKSTSPEISTELLETGTLNVKFPILSLCNAVETVSDETDTPKRIRLSPGKLKNIPSNPGNETPKEEKTEEIEEKTKSLDCNKRASESELTDLNECGQTNSILRNNDQNKKEKGDSAKKKLGEDWLELKNFEGKLFYFHVPSGLTSFNAPSNSRDATLYTMSKRSEFLPKGMSPLLAGSSSSLYGVSRQHLYSKKQSSDGLDWSNYSLEHDDLRTVKWREKSKIFNKDISEVLDITKAYISEKRILPSNTSIPDLSSISAKMSGLLFQQKFDKIIFTNLQVIGQLDNKFIVTLCSLDKNSSPHILGMFDQHAVHERIRLETLMKEYLSDEDEWSFKATKLSETIELAVSSKEFDVMSSFPEKFKKLGFHFMPKEKRNIAIHRIPSCLYNRALREPSSDWLEGTLHIFIQDVVQFLLQTDGQDLVVPEVFKDVINSEACKGAIKFGDPLSISNCEDLLTSLSKCDLPFYCAHGRLSFMPVFDLRQFEAERKKYMPEY